VSVVQQNAVAITQETAGRAGAGEQVTLKVLRWEERDKRLLVKEGEAVA
jgi:hypothetical protein